MRADNSGLKGSPPTPRTGEHHYKEPPHPRGVPAQAKGLPSARDGSPEGGDGAAGSVHESPTAATRGVQLLIRYLGSHDLGRYNELAFHSIVLVTAHQFDVGHAEGL